MATTTSPLLLDREFLKTLEQVTLLCRTNLSGAVGPEHRSRTRGPGMEFADYRRYSFGDDPRSLDWSAYLRLGKLFLKIYETEQHIPVRILLDRSESMNFGGNGESKFLYAQRLAATFAYLALLHLDATSVFPFADCLQKPMVASGGRDRLWPAQRTVECSPQSTALYERRFLEFCARLRRLAVRNGGRYARAVTNIAYQEFVLRSLRSGQVIG